jgi:hypothetical protein
VQKRISRKNWTPILPSSLKLRSLQTRWINTISSRRIIWTKMDKWDLHKMLVQKLAEFLTNFTQKCLAILAAKWFWTIQITDKADTNALCRETTSKVLWGWRQSFRVSTLIIMVLN